MFGSFTDPFNCSLAKLSPFLLPNQQRQSTGANQSTKSAFPCILFHIIHTCSNLSAWHLIIT